MLSYCSAARGRGPKIANGSNLFVGNQTQGGHSATRLFLQRIGIRDSCIYERDQTCNLTLGNPLHPILQTVMGA